MKINPARIVFYVCVLSLFARLSGFAQDTAFTYQGRLDYGANVANGSYDLKFALFDSAAGGSQQGSSFTNMATTVTNGLFTVTVDFGNQFPGDPRWLEISLRTNTASTFTLLNPRQALKATPYAQHAAEASTAESISGMISAIQLSGPISSNNIAAGTITSLMLANGAVTASALADNAVTADKLFTAGKYKVVTVITNPAPFNFDYFGQAVAACGPDRVIVGAYAQGTNDSGAVYLLSTNGLLLATCANPDPLGTNMYGLPGMDMFGFFVAGLGTDKIIVGAYRQDIGAADSGAAYLFNQFGTLITTFTNPTPAVEDFFGYSVAAVGADKVLIGARWDDTPGTDEGSAYLFSTNGQLLVAIVNPAPSVGDAFGYAVAACGSDRVVISSFGEAYLFSTNGTLLATLKNPSSDPNTFGASIAVVDSRWVLIGAIGDGSSSGVVSAGAAYLFDTNGILLTTLTNPVPSAYAWFGAAATAVGSDKLLIGSNTRSTYLFDMSGFLLATITNPVPASDGFGLSLASLGSDKVVVGAGRSDIGATDAGAAHLISIATFAPGVISQGVSWGSIDTDSLVDRAVTASKIANSAITFQKLDSILGTNIAFLNANQTFLVDNRFLGSVAIGTNNTATAKLYVTTGSATNSTSTAAFFTPLRGTHLSHIHSGATGDWYIRSATNTGKVVIQDLGGNVGIANSDPTDLLVVGNARCDGSTWINASDQRLKENFSTIDPTQILAKVVSLPISRWNYRGQSNSAHLGPVAQDFNRVFGLGTSQGIATVDADGVVLSAIQGLNQKLEAENAALKARVERLERLVEKHLK